MPFTKTFSLNPFSLNTVGLKMGITNFQLQLGDETEVDDDIALGMVQHGDILYAVSINGR